MNLKSFAILILAASSLASADPTKVGNADTGGDLEKLDLIKTGILISTRDKAVELCQKQQTDQISGLSKLIPELQKSDIYLSQTNVSPVLKTDHQAEISEDGRFVYARTFAEPHAAVRFFPAALMLTEDQLIKLHIHEALHRALPANIREDEAVVSEITLALTAVDGSRDRTQKLMDGYLAKPEPLQMAGAVSGLSQMQASPTEKLKNPSSFSYSYQAFSLTEEDRDLFPLEGMHKLKSLLYPFGDNASVRGIGIQFSYLTLEDQAFMGPLALTASTLFATWRGFDVEGFAEGSLYTLSQEELTNLPKTRDTLTLGISMKKETDSFYTSNFLSITPGNQKEFKIGNTKYTEDYEAVLNARIEGGVRFGSLSAGVLGDFLLTEGSEVKAENGTFSTVRERIRAVRFGPQVSYRYNNLEAQVFAHTLLDRTPGYSMSDFGNLMGLGAGISTVGASLTFVY